MKSTEPRRKVYEIQTQLFDTYGQAYIDIEQLKNTIQFYATHDREGKESEKPLIRLYAGIIHDRDTYTEEEVKNADKPIAVGDPKPEHIHMVINLNNGMTASAVCKLFSLDPRQLVYVKRRDQDDDKDTDTFNDKAMYISHWRHPEKAQYQVSDIFCNFNYEEEFKRYCQSAARKSKSKHSQAFIKEHVNKLANGEETIQDIIREYGYDAYEYGKIKFDHAQAYYEKTAMSPVPTRLTFLITGPSTVGKTPLAKLYACALFPDLRPQEAFYLAADSANPNLTFHGYMGQPVIIYDDWRAVSFLSCFSRDRLFNSLFAVYPEPSAFNIKYGSVTLKHTVNIITTVEDPNDFIRGIAGEYSDKFGLHHQAEYGQVLQSYKRVWSITRISEADILIQINAGYLSGDVKAYYDQYISLARLSNNVKALVQKYNPELYAMIGQAQFPKLIEETHAQIEKNSQKISDPALLDPADLSAGETFDIQGQISMFDHSWETTYSDETPEQVSASLHDYMREHPADYDVDPAAPTD